MTDTACPSCQHRPDDPALPFCTACGLCLEQPCPQCNTSLRTPKEPFQECSVCKHSFWACQACARLAYLDQTSCRNTYCPDFGKFWTTRFGGERSYPGCPQTQSYVKGDSPRPAWTEGATAGADLRWPSLHAEGMLLSVQESGVVELWAERGAPFRQEDSDFSEKSVCLTRMDLGDISPCPPFFWGKSLCIPGASSLVTLELTSSPSFGNRYPLELFGRPRFCAPFENKVLVWGDKGLGFLESDGQTQLLNPLPVKANSLFCQGLNQYFLADLESKTLIHLCEKREMASVTWPLGFEKLEYLAWAEGFLGFGGSQMIDLTAQESVSPVDLPSLVLARPVYSISSERLLLALGDSTIRSCSRQGDRFSFVCEMAGTPCTPLLALGESVFYGTEGRYLCRDEEALRPRLSAPPSGEFTVANGRIFGNLRDGSMFCFEL